MNPRLCSASLMLGLLWLASSACTLGPGRYRQEGRPGGAFVEIELPEESLHAELLAVDEQGLDVWAGVGIRRLSWREIDEFEVEQFEDLKLEDGRPPRREQIDRLRLLCRFPQGMTPDIRAALGDGRETSARDPAEFLARARAAAARYADPERATAEGFTRVGPETAEMGEHWVRWRTIARGIFDPDQPSILVYATRGGRRELAGVAYALVVEPGESPPAPPPGARWHAHAGTVAEELVSSHSAAVPSRATPGARVVVIHAWTHVRNPEGPFEPANAALPAWREDAARDSPSDALR
ncbi:MAG TPA: hypothetical protein VIE68_04165 [Gemmatimonadota bacterium]